MSLDDLDIRSLPVGHLPIIRACLDQLGVFAVLDEHLPQHPQAHASDAECLAVMVLNILSGRVALWRMDQRFEHVDLELLLGDGVQASWFHDNRLGRALDHIDKVGTDTLLSEIVVRYLNRQDVGPFTVHLDHTSVSVYGVYDTDKGPTPAHGHSKDHRPDLKQLVYGLSLHGAVGIPLTMGVQSGNTSDNVANRDHLTKLVGLLPRPEDVTIVADCKLVDGETLGRLTHAGFHFVSLVPKTFRVREALIDQAWEAEADVSAWPILASRPGAKKADPHQLYRGRSFTGSFALELPTSKDAQGAPSVEELRCVVVHSDALVEAFDQSLPGKLEREGEELAKTHRGVLAKEYACEADARNAVIPLLKRLRWHTATVNVEQKEVVEKRARRGRPPKDAPPPATRTVFVPTVTLAPDDEAIAAGRRRASCFVLVTDWAEDEWSDARVLDEYRHQSLVEGHTGFRWLKGPAAVAPVFLETPTRIRALGFVFMIALMVRNYIQFTLRRQMKERNRPVRHPFRNKPDDKLTTEMALVWFDGVTSLALRMPGAAWKRRPTKLPDEAVDVLELLGIDKEVFTRPPVRRNSGVVCRGPLE
jgi:transposase